MKKAIASEGKDITSNISVQAGRAPYILIFENEKLIETIKNPFAKGSGGAGFSVAYMLAEKKVEKFIAGKIGPNMQSAFKEKKIKFEEKLGKITKEIESNG